MCENNNKYYAFLLCSYKWAYLPILHMHLQPLGGMWQCGWQQYYYSPNTEIEKLVQWCEAGSDRQSKVGGLKRHSGRKRVWLQNVDTAAHVTDEDLVLFFPPSLCFKMCFINLPAHGWDLECFCLHFDKNMRLSRRQWEAWHDRSK